MTKVSFAALEPGQRFVGPGRTLTETDHAMFMMLVGDWSPIHSDETYAKATPFGTRIMHGGFGIALALGMQASVLDFAEPVVAALGLREWAYKAPLLIGDTVHVEIEILSKRRTSRADRGIVERRILLCKDDQSVAQEGVSEIMLDLRGLAKGDDEPGWTISKEDGAPPDAHSWRP